MSSLSTVLLALAGLSLVLGMMTVVWVLSLVRRDASIVDVFWGPGVFLTAWFYGLIPGAAEHPRSLLALGLVTLWGLRLALYIGWRGRGQGEDPRYLAMRKRWGNVFPWLSFFSVFLFQGVLLWIISLPLLVAIRSPAPIHLTWIDDLGLGLFAVGFAFEVVADYQLARFRRLPGQAGDVLRRGLWRYSRHPNYFGEAVLWWGFGALALATGAWWALVSPVLMTFLLLRVSGVVLLEKGLVKTRPSYRDYQETTSAFIPWPPRRQGSGEGELS